MTMQNKTTSRREFVAGSLAAALGGAIPFNGSAAAENPGDWAESKGAGAEQAAFPRSGHVPHEEEAAAFNARLRGFLSRIPKD